MCALPYEELLDDFEFQPEIDSFLESETGRRRRRRRPARRPASKRIVPRPVRRPPPGRRVAITPGRGLLKYKIKPSRPPLRPVWPFGRLPLVVIPERPGKPPEDGLQRQPKEPGYGEPLPGGDAPGYAAPTVEGNEYIRWVQSTLNAILGLELPLDGLLGPQTRAALMSFQRQAGLPADGILGPETKQALVAYRQQMMPPAGEFKRFGQTRNSGSIHAELDSVAGQLQPFQHSGGRIMPSHLLTVSVPRRNEMYPGEYYEMYEIGGEAETGIEVAGVALGAASLGLGIFGTIHQILSSGDLAVSADLAWYYHPNTPANIPYVRTTQNFSISAYHPLLTNWQIFYFRLSFEYNGYDLKNVKIGLLRDISSSMYASTFKINFRAAQDVSPTEPISAIKYHILDGRWDPVGPGDISFEGEFRVDAKGNISTPPHQPWRSDRNWVRWNGLIRGTRTDTRISLPPTPGLAPPSSGGGRILRQGARGQPVTDLQTRLNRWLISQGRQPLIVDGVFGSRTKAAVIAFQQAVHLRPDGVVGPKTWGTLIKYY